MWIIIAVTIIAFGVWVGEVVLTPFPETKKKRSSQNIVGISLFSQNKR